jgi:hypothetical protein
MICTAGQIALMVLETVETVATAKTPKDPNVSVGYHHSGIETTLVTVKIFVTIITKYVHETTS